MNFREHLKFWTLTTTEFLKRVNSLKDTKKFTVIRLKSTSIGFSRGSIKMAQVRLITLIGLLLPSIKIVCSLKKSLREPLLYLIRMVGAPFLLMKLRIRSMEEMQTN